MSSFISAVKKSDGSSWRERELSLKEVIHKYPSIPPLIILKADVQRRGVVLTREAIQGIDPERDDLHYRGLNAENRGGLPNGLLLRDGTTILANIAAAGSSLSNISATDIQNFERNREPYTIDLVEGKPMLIDQGEIVEAVDYWPRPEYSAKLTSKGTPMWQVLIARPQRMDINIYQNCDFWKEPGMGCKFCFVGATYHKNKNEKSEFVDYDDVIEAVGEALKQPGRFRMIQLCSGSLIGGDELLDKEVNCYIEMLQRIGNYFTGKKVMTQIVATAFNERQLRRLYNETILSSYTADIEVLNEALFNWVCPGKAKYIGYQEWKNRLYKAAEIFGPNTVDTGIVSGVELAEPEGFHSEDEALEKCLAEAEDLARHGVGVAQTVFHVEPGSRFAKQKTATLDYLIAFTKGLDDLRRLYHLEYYYDDYRTCGNHPNTDLFRC
jgi:hypothetical protein